jgi:cell division septal protein FtsQ
MRGKGVVGGLFFLSLIATLALAAGTASWRAFQAYREGEILIVNRIEVSGNRHWESSALLEASGLEVGARLPRVSLGKAREALRQLPGIQDVSVGRSWSGDVRVRVREEEVLALARDRRGGWSGLTASGSWMRLSTPDMNADLPVIEGGKSRGPALAAFLTEVRRGFPDLYRGFSQIVPAAGNAGGADIYWRDQRVKVRLDYTNKSLNSLEFLRTLLRREADGWPPGSTVDLRVEGYAYVL